MKIKNTLKKNLHVYSLLFLFIIIGIFIRVAFQPDIITLNTSGFFYHRAAYLVNHGEYLKIDTKGRYPSSYAEDYPPFLILISVAFYKLSFSKDLLVFLSYFPVTMFLFISLLGFFILYRIFNKAVGLFFVMLFSVIPSAVRFTSKGFYTEEAVGVFLLIGFIYCLARLKDHPKYLYAGIIFLTLFIITWQTFVIIYAALFVMFVLSIKDKILLKRLVLLVIIPILLAYIISVIFIGLSYSPFQIFKESYISLVISKSLDFRIAFDRNDLINTNKKMFFDEYSYFSIFSVLGALVCIWNFKYPSYRSVLIMSFFGLISVLMYLKLRYFLLPFIMILSSIGLSHLYEIKKSDKKIIMLFLIIIGIFLIFQASSALISSKHPECKIEFELLTKKIMPGYPYRINMQIKNVGGDPFCDADYSTLHAFGGIHVEIENARILSKKINSRYTSTLIVDKEAQNNISWFEAKFDCLKALTTANLTFEILPLKLPTKIYYRCWIPDKCDLEPPKDLVSQYRAAWRNENCIKRQPINGDYCKVDVFAGHETIQKYYCYSKNFSS